MRRPTAKILSKKFKTDILSKCRSIIDDEKVEEIFNRYSLMLGSTTIMRARITTLSDEQQRLLYEKDEPPDWYESARSKYANAYATKSLGKKEIRAITKRLIESIEGMFYEVPDKKLLAKIRMTCSRLSRRTK